MKSFKELKEFAKSKISKEYTVVDYQVCNKSDKELSSHLLVIENIDDEVYATNGMYDDNSEEWLDLSNQKDGITVLSVNNYSIEEFNNLIDNDWSDSMVKASEGREIEL